jgi:hypothetical protein
MQYAMRSQANFLKELANKKKEEGRSPLSVFQTGSADGGCKTKFRPNYSLEPFARTQPYPRRNAIDELDASIFKSVQHCDQTS